MTIICVGGLNWFFLDPNMSSHGEVCYRLIGANVISLDVMSSEVDL